MLKCLGRFLNIERLWHTGQTDPTSHSTPDRHLCLTVSAGICMPVVAHKSPSSESLGDHQCHGDTVCQAETPRLMTPRDLGVATRFMLH